MRLAQKHTQLPDKSEENTIAAILVLYYPESSILDNILRLKNQVKRVIIINNGCNNSLLTEIRNTFTLSEQIVIINNKKNEGLAHALNQGMTKIIEIGVPWALLLDQDTLIDKDMIKQQIQNISHIKTPFFILGTNYRNYSHFKTAFQCPKKEQTFSKKTTIITSGTFISTTTYNRLGPFQTRFFIDSIDHEYSLRAQKEGIDVLISCDALMTHSIGIDNHLISKTPYRIMAQPHSAERKYYICRNSLATARMYFHYFPAWSIRQFFKVAAELLATIVFEDNKLKRISYIIRGTINGLKLNFKPGPYENIK